MRNCKISPAFYDLTSQHTHLQFHWMRREVVPDYNHITKRPPTSNKFAKKYDVIRLSDVESPWLKFGNYFTPRKLEELDARKEAFFANGERHINHTTSEAAELLALTDQDRTKREVKHLIKKRKRASTLNSSRKFANLSDASQLLKLRTVDCMTLSAAAKAMRVPINRVKYLWRLLSTAEGGRLLSDHAKLTDELLVGEAFRPLVEELLAFNTAKSKTVKQLFNDFKVQNPDVPVRNLAHFYGLLGDQGFTYKPFQLQLPRVSRWTNAQRDFVKTLTVEFITNCSDFTMLWVDESSICPQNFQKKGWGLRGRKLVVESNLRYDKLKMLGVMSTSKVVALQFLQGSNTQRLFDFFLIEVLKRVLRDNPSHRTPVVFLDNSPLHRSRQLLEFCRRNGVLLVFNLVCHPTANPIELLWRFLKLPMKRIVNATT